jgi:hypothetical protein
VTNRHVIAGAYEITAILPDFPPLPAKPVFVSALIDVAILKVAAGWPLPQVKLGASDNGKALTPQALQPSAIYIHGDTRAQNQIDAGSGKRFSQPVRLAASATAGLLARAGAAEAVVYFSSPGVTPSRT